MVKHIVMFQFREQISPDERQQTGWEVKTRTEALVDIIPGIQSLQVQLVPVGTSTHDILLEGVFDSQESLMKYQIHPAHMSIGDILKQVGQCRACFDYEI